MLNMNAPKRESLEPLGSPAPVILQTVACPRHNITCQSQGPSAMPTQPREQQRWKNPSQLENQYNNVTQRLDGEKLHLDFRATAEVPSILGLPSTPKSNTKQSTEQPAETPTQTLDLQAQSKEMKSKASDPSGLGLWSSVRNWPTVLKVFRFLIVLVIVLPPALGLANCPIDCDCDDDILTVTCGEGSLDVLPITLNPRIHRLTIKRNRIRTIDSSIQFYAALTFLDLSYNDLNNIPFKTFFFQRNLTELYIKNNKIAQISNKTFAGLVSLEVLNLRGNLIAELEYGSFTPMTSLTTLDLGQNRISTIHPQAFNSLSNLQNLYLDDNTLTTVPSDLSFKSLPNLERLFLGINSFMSLSAGSFRELRKLRHLDLKGAGLHNISQTAFEGLGNLQTLDLSDNRLEQVPSLSLGSLKSLKFLALGQNDFEVIATGDFGTLKTLKGLEITGAQRLRRLEANLFSENSQLEYLNISSNKLLNEIDENAFQGLQRSLKNVSLKENQLSTFSELMLPWKSLAILDLAGNPLSCDCRIYWLQDLLIQKNISENFLESGIVCAFPEKLKDKSLALISSNDLGCSQPDSNQVLWSALGVAGVAVIVLIILSYACRGKIHDLIKCNWNNSALSHKEQEYQKTFSDEEYRTRQTPHMRNQFGNHASAPFDHNVFNPHQTNYIGSSPIPVTEL